MVGHTSTKLKFSLSVVLESSVAFWSASGFVFFWASRIRIRIHWSEVQIRRSGSVPKCHGSATLLESSVLLFRDETAGNGSHGCQIYNPALMECHVKWEPSYFQFWEKYILQVYREKGLKNTTVPDFYKSQSFYTELYLCLGWPSRTESVRGFGNS